MSLAAEFEQRFRGAIADGRSPDSLCQFDTDEARRFLSLCAEGADHTYWIGPKTGFRDNDRRKRQPRRYAYSLLHGPIDRWVDVWSTCGERTCIRPTHLEAGRSEARRKWTEERMIGALQVIAMRLGHAPSYMEWERARYNPDMRIIRQRFGNYKGYLRAAGLDPDARGRTGGERE